MADGHEVALTVVRGDALQSDRERFATAARRLCDHREALPGVLRVLAVAASGEAYLTDLCTMGCAKDLAALAWPAKRRLDFARAVAKEVASLHRLGIVHGCLSDENVLLSDDLKPLLAEVGNVSVHDLSERGAEVTSYVAFAAPEVNEGAAPDVRSDVFSMGRLIQYLLRGDDVPQIADVVRKCVAPSPLGRYASAAELASAGARAPAPPPPRPAAVDVATVPVFETAEAAPGPPPRWPVPTGVAFVMGSAALSFLVGGASANVRAWLSAAMFAGAALAAWGVHPAPRTPMPLRIAFALAIGVVVLLLDPLALGYRSAASRAVKGDAASRAAAIDQIRQLGRNFKGISLAGVDLSGHDLRGADLRGVDLSGSNLSHARLWGAMLEGASLDGAILVGADLLQTDLSDALHVDSAACSPETLLPKPWSCIAAGSESGRLSAIELPAAR